MRLSHWFPCLLVGIGLGFREFHSTTNAVLTENSWTPQLDAETNRKVSYIYIAKERSKEPKETAKQEQTQRSMISTAKGSASKHSWAAHKHGKRNDRNIAKAGDDSDDGYRKATNELNRSATTTYIYII